MAKIVGFIGSLLVVQCFSSSDFEFANYAQKFDVGAIVCSKNKLQFSLFSFELKEHLH